MHQWKVVKFFLTIYEETKFSCLCMLTHISASLPVPPGVSRTGYSVYQKKVDKHLLCFLFLIIKVWSMCTHIYISKPLSVHPGVYAFVYSVYQQKEVKLFLFSYLEINVLFEATHICGASLPVPPGVFASKYSVYQKKVVIHFSSHYFKAISTKLKKCLFPHHSHMKYLFDVMDGIQTVNINSIGKIDKQQHVNHEGYIPGKGESLLMLWGIRNSFSSFFCLGLMLQSSKVKETVAAAGNLEVAVPPLQATSTGRGSAKPERGDGYMSDTLSIVTESSEVMEVTGDLSSDELDLDDASNVTIVEAAPVESCDQRESANGAMECKTAPVAFQGTPPGTSCAAAVTLPTAAEFLLGRKVVSGAAPDGDNDLASGWAMARPSKSKQRKLRRLAHVKQQTDEGAQGSGSAVRVAGNRQSSAAKRPLSAGSSLESSDPKRQSGDRDTRKGGDKSVTQGPGDSMKPKSSKPSNTRRPQGTEATPPELELILDNLAAEKGMLTVDQVELLRFRISTLILVMPMELLGPEFGYTYSGFSNGQMSIHCRGASSRDWLLANTKELNEAFDGADIRARPRTDIPVQNRVAGFFPMPRKVDSAFLVGLLTRQNQKLNVQDWTLMSAEYVKGKDPSHPMTGSGYWIRFGVEDECLAALEANGFSVFFATTVVKLKCNNKSGQPQKEVTDDAGDANPHGDGA